MHLTKHLSRKNIILTCLIVIILSLAVLGYLKAIEIGTQLWLEMPAKLLGHETPQARLDSARLGVSALDYQPDLEARASKQAEDDLIWKVYRLESSAGKHDVCHNYGKVNGFGFGIYGNRIDCYGSHAEVESLVRAWFHDKWANGLTIPQSLCLYNTGHATSDCPYYQKYLIIE